MISAITINYSGRDFFGQHEPRSDTYEGHVSKAMVRKVLNAVQRGGYYAHFIREDGTDEVVYMEGEKADGCVLTWVHFDSPYSQDAPVKIKMADFRRLVFSELE